MTTNASQSTRETAYFAGGCFWGVEHNFRKVPGVFDAISGYQQGHVKNPTYEEVCSGDSGHTESVMVEFDRDKVQFEKLCRFFLYLVDPTTLNQQGNDIGTQYRSGIYCVNEAQMQTARAVIDEVEKDSHFGGRKIVVEVLKAETFYRAEEYHQRWLERMGGFCGCNFGKAIQAML